MTWRDFLFGPTPTLTPSEAARTLGAVARQNDRERKLAKLADLRWEIDHGIIAPLGWKA